MAKLIVGIIGLLIFYVPRIFVALDIITQNDLVSSLSISYDTHLLCGILSWFLTAMGIDELRKSKKKQD